MKIIGFNLTRFLSERKEKLEGELKVSQNINIVEVEKEKISISKDEALKVDFLFTIEYGAGDARIEFKGRIIILPEKEEMKRILKSWKDKEMDEDLKLPLFNFILAKCNIKALNAEDELGLPPHIQMPSISSKKE